LISHNGAGKHCIMPLKLMNREANRNFAVHLINHGVSVSIEENNHSKWLMSESEIYYGSANFSVGSLRDRLEVVSFRDFVANDPLRRQFARFALQSMNNMRYNSQRKRLSGIITKNQRLIAKAKPLVKKLNPSIEKVISTVESVNAVRNMMMGVLSNSFWLLSDDYYQELALRTKDQVRLIQRVYREGIELLNMYREKADIQNKVNIYNDACMTFQGKAESYSTLAEDFLMSQNSVPEFTLTNEGLASRNVKYLRKYTV
jgi:hypothetical protein